MGAEHFGPGFFGCKHPFDSRASIVALAFPGGDLGDEFVTLFDPSVQTLAAQNTDLDLDHVEPAGVLGREVELQASQHASGLCRGESLVEGGGTVGREVVEHDADLLGLGGDMI